MEKNFCSVFFQKKVQNASEKKMNGEITIQNGEKSFFLRSVFHLHFHILQKKMVKTLLKKSEWRFLHSEWRFLHSEWRKVSGKQFAENFQKKS
jgi:diadenosine tetraphosphate (Ap4A) HIT family hydrolase